MDGTISHGECLGQQKKKQRNNNNKNMAEIISHTNSIIQLQ